MTLVICASGDSLHPVLYQCISCSACTIGSLLLQLTKWGGGWVEGGWEGGDWVEGGWVDKEGGWVEGEGD